MSLYSLKLAQTGIQSWQSVLSIGKAIFDFYPSLGDFTSAGSITLPTLLDGPIQVVRYGALTLNHVLTVSNRCRGLIILCDSFTGGAAGGINMTGKGAAGQSWWPWYNLTVPTSLSLASSRMSAKEVLDYFRTTGHYIGDPVLWAQAMSMGWTALPGVTGTIVEGIKILDASKCGANRVGGSTTTTQYSYISGSTGNVGVQGTGGGGSGSVINLGISHAISAGSGKRGCPWGGGPGAGGQNWFFTPDSGTASADDHGGRGGMGAGGGGAGNPGGVGQSATAGEDGTGGIFMVLSKGPITLASGFVGQADGKNGGSYAPSQSMGGSGSGGGFQAWIRGAGQALTLNSSTRRCNGGVGGAHHGSYPGSGGAGGAGAILDLQFSDLGW